MNDDVTFVNRLNMFRVFCVCIILVLISLSQARDKVELTRQIEELEAKIEMLSDNG